ncbi:hypothetical protein BMF35_a0597 [Aurantiacibacter gangjinensis]|nr:hypothetical protein BMF35_a0597 [Aurantiacibacter gangjinensis]
MTVKMAVERIAERGLLSPGSRMIASEHSTRGWRLWGWGMLKILF